LSEIKLKKNVHSRNQEFADQNRQQFQSAGIFTVNILGSPGAGKTSLVEQTVQQLSPLPRILVIEGDVETEYDADRIRKLGVEAIQIQTHGACHLDAIMIREYIGEKNLSDFQLLFIENVGNLICPAGFDLGEDTRVVVGSTTEGDDKPIKYPEMYYTANACVINKIDLIPHINFNLEDFKTRARQANEDLLFLPLSCTSGEGMAQWLDWLKQGMASRQG